MPSNHLILCCPLLLPPSIFPSIRVFSSESALCIRWPKYWSFSFSISPSYELLLLLSHFSRVFLCVIPQTAAHQAPPSLRFSRQKHWSGLPFPSPMCEREVAQSCLTLSDPTNRSLPGCSIHGIFQAGVLEWGAIAFSVPMNTQDWSPLGWTGWISLQSKGLSRVFSNTTVQKHQFFSPQFSL